MLNFGSSIYIKIMKKYKVTNTPSNILEAADLEKYLNEVSDDGWQLVQIVMDEGITFVVWQEK